MDIQKIYNTYLKSNGVSTDTRTLQKGAIFFALQGDNFNGNKYAEEALDKGARIAIIDDVAYKKNDNYIVVNNSLKILQDLAAFHRETLNIPIIGITGSNGKTTTKELIYAVLNSKYKTYATKGNLNNHIGVPLSLLNITKDYEIAIIEMGANHQGEIASYCKWVKPTHGLITNIGKAHLEGFGGIEGVRKGKTELYKALANNNSTVFYNYDDDILALDSEIVAKRFSYGKSKEADVTASLLDSNQSLEIQYLDKTIHTHLTGAYNFYNILSAIAIGEFFKLSPSDIKTSIASYIPKNNRSEIIKQNGNTIILDAYNANPTSMQAALNNLALQTANNKGAILGDMYELGKDEATEHKGIIEMVSKLKLDIAVFVGKRFFTFKKDYSTFLFFKTTKEAKDWFANNSLKSYTLLIKGSRAMQLETILA